MTSQLIPQYTSSPQKTSSICPAQASTARFVQHPCPILPSSAMSISPAMITPGMRVIALAMPHSAASHGCPRRSRQTAASVRQMNSASVYAQHRNTLSGLSRKYAVLRRAMSRPPRP